MQREAGVEDLNPLIRSRRELLEDGWRERGIDSAVRQSSLRLVRRGWYMREDAWQELWPEGRHLAHVIAVARDARGAAVASHESAAVVWGLPLYRHRPRKVHLTTDAPARISSGRDVQRHVAALPDADVVSVRGLRVTSLARTVFDLIRVLPPEPAVAAADAAERRIALRGGRWSEEAAAAWRDDVHERIAKAVGARGIVQARRVAAFANGRAQLPLESVSRLMLVRAGFAPPRLQVPVRAPHGGTYYLDFGLDDVGAWGEVDGKGKYLDRAMRQGRSLEQVLLDEKQREDWIRGTTHRRLVRWSEEHLVSLAAFTARLRAFGLRPAS